MYDLLWNTVMNTDPTQSLDGWAFKEATLENNIKKFVDFGCRD